jgi:hypothetical protein
MRHVFVCVVLTLTAASGCSRQPAAAAKTAVPQTAAAPPAAAVPQQAAAAPSQPDGQSVAGTVVETMDASNYTYVRVKTDAGDVWAATAQFKVSAGDRVVVPLEMPMENFHSQSLKRDFPLIYFATHIDREGAPMQPAMAAAHSAHESSAPGSESSQAAEVIPPVKGVTSVADVWAKRASLVGKRVTVRGKVVKFNPAILGRNWVHVQDGSGTKSNGSDDLTITTAAPASIGEVIALTGTVAVKKDFGAGYAYEVMLENATVAAP